MPDIIYYNRLDDSDNRSNMTGRGAGVLHAVPLPIHRHRFPCRPYFQPPLLPKRGVSGLRYPTLRPRYRLKRALTYLGVQPAV